MTTKTRATEALRTMFGPTARIARVDRAGVSGYEVVTDAGIVYRTFDKSGDVWRRCVRFSIPAWLQREGRA